MQNQISKERKENEESIDVGTHRIDRLRVCHRSVCAGTCGNISANDDNDNDDPGT
jgi:hypothetical protein